MRRVRRFRGRLFTRPADNGLRVKAIEREIFENANDFVSWTKRS